MTTGNTSKTFFKSLVDIHRFTFVPNIGWQDSLQASRYVFQGTQTKTWNGGDRIVSVTPASLGYKRYYTIPEKVNYVDKRTGKTVTKTVLKQHFFWVGRKPRRVERYRLNTPHGYTMSSVTSRDALSRHSYQDATGKLIWYEPSSSIFRRLGPPTWRGSSTSFDANDQLALIGKLREKIRGSDFNLSVFVGEGHQTLKLIADSATRVATAYTKARKGYWYSAAKTLLGTDRAIQHVRTHFPQSKQGGLNLSPRLQRYSDNLKNSKEDRLHTVEQGKRKLFSQAWLELQYGWLPLLEDMDSASKQLANHLNLPKQSTYRATKKRRVDNRPLKTDWQYTEDYYQLQRTIIALVEEVPSNLYLSGVAEPELVVWELTPFSFVADWFAPVGKWLEAKSLERNIKATYITTDYVKRVYYGAKSTQYNLDGSTYSIGSGDARYESCSLTRTVSTSLNVPAPRVKSLGEAMTLKHTLNALALFTQAVTASTPKYLRYERELKF